MCIEMTLSTDQSLRAILPLGKGRVIDRGDWGFKLAIGGSTTITVSLAHMQHYDIKDGDLLTLYTEVLLAKPS